MPYKNWSTVKFEEFGANLGNVDFEGLAGFEECEDYNVVSSKKNKKLKRKPRPNRSERKVPNKKAKTISGDFVIVNVHDNSSTVHAKAKKNAASDVPSKKNNDENAEESTDNVKSRKKNKGKVDKSTKNVDSKKKIKESVDKSADIDNLEKKSVDKSANNGKSKKNASKKSKKKKSQKKNASKPVEIENEVESTAIPLDDLQAWSNFGISEVILKAIAEQGFQKPTTIQELTLPAAMHGRRDILGAAETGSGKTLAFGIPIINGILLLKEKLSKGESIDLLPDEKEDVYSFEKSDEKIINFNKLTKEERKKVKEPYKKKFRNKQFLKKSFRRNDREDDENSDDSDDLDEDDSTDDSDDEAESDDDDSDNEEVSENVHSDGEESQDESDESSGEIEENLIEDEATDDSDQSSDESDSDLVNSSENSQKSNENNKSQDSDNSDDEDSDFEEHEETANGENEDGIGCVRVIDNIVPEESTKTIPKNCNMKPLYALILTPTRELAIQVKNHLIAAAKHSDIRVAVVVGGMAQVKQERILKKGPEIVVATPGRLWEMIQQGNDHLSQVGDIRYLAIDETDRMIERGHFEELHLLLDKINDDEKRKARRQNFVFSATLTMVHELPMHLKTKKFTKRGKAIKKKYEKLTSEQKLKKVIEMLGITNPKVVDVTEKNRGSSNTLTECRISCPIDHKDYYLYYVLKRHPGRTIVFCNSIGCVKRLAQLFGLLQCKPLPLHANMQQRQRLKNLDRFRADPHGVLIATDVAARGLDIPNVEHVIHYQVPRTAENYVHRSGRTARANKEGITILIMEPNEVLNYVKVCRTLSKADDLPHFPVPDTLLSATKQRVNLARELDQLELRMRKTNSEIGWYEKSMKEMDIVLDEREMPQRVDKDSAAEQKSLLAVKKRQLTSLLAAHLFPKGFSFKYPTMNSSMEETLAFGKKENAIEAMKSAMKSGSVKNLKKSTKNQAHLSLVNQDSIVHKKNPKSGKVKKNKWKKMKRNKKSS